MNSNSNITHENNDEEINRKILRERARILALKDDDEKPDEMEVLLFNLSHENYAFETFEIKEVVKVNEITPLPSTPDYIRGIINVRGEILSVIDIRVFFNLNSEIMHDSYNIIIMKHANKMLGVIADEITGVFKIPKVNMQASLPTLDADRHQYLKGISNERVIILDAKKILTDKNLIIDEEI